MSSLRELTDTLGLRFAVPDFVADHGERWHFVGDLNPNGQWVRENRSTPDHPGSSRGTHRTGDHVTQL